MKIFAYSVVILSIAVVSFAGFTNIKNPFSLTSIAIMLWAISPYLYQLLMINFVSSKAAIITAFVCIVIACAFGLFVIIDSMYIHVDSEKGLIIIFAPMWQWAGLLLASIPLFIINQVNNK